MKSAEEYADECCDPFDGTAMSKEDFIKFIRAIQSDVIRAAAEKCEDAGTIFCSVDMSTATIRVKNFKNIKSEILSLIQD